MPVTANTTIHIEGDVPARARDLGQHGAVIWIGDENTDGWRYAIDGTPEDLRRWLVAADAAVQELITARAAEEETGDFEWVEVQALHDGDTVHLETHGWVRVTDLYNDGISNQVDWAGYRENGTGVVLRGSLELAHAIRRRLPVPAAQVA